MKLHTFRCCVIIAGLIFVISAMGEGKKTSARQPASLPPTASQDPVGDLLSDRMRADLEVYANQAYAKWDQYWRDPLAQEGLKAMSDAQKIDAAKFQELYQKGLAAKNDIQEATNSEQRFEHLPDADGDGRRFGFTTPNGKNVSYKFAKVKGVYKITDIEVDFASVWKPK